jgi:Skp family chaperone for outer membrane proteins
MKRIFIAVALVASLTACGNQPKSDIGLIDEERIKANWPKFLNYQNQLSYDAQSIERSGKPEKVKQQLRAALQQRFAQDQIELSNDVSDAAKQIATNKHLTYVFTRQYVGYGGVDITPDIEKILKIEEKATPAP